MIEKYIHFLVANWVLISFLVSSLSALVVAGYVLFVYHVGPFESYRNVSTTKKLSEFYERMGERLMVSNEWQAAEQAYTTALQVNPNNVAATFGITKARVFQPLPGQKYCVPEVMDAKLEYLSSCFPDDYHVIYLWAIRYHERGEIDKAKEYLRRCAEKNPDFAGSYLQLGTINFREAEISEAVANFSKVLELDPDSATAMNDLGACHMLSQEFPEATRQFSKSYQIAPTAVTAQSLGEAYLFSGDYADALAMHKDLLKCLEKADTEFERYIGNMWYSAFMPISAEDKTILKQAAVPIYTLEQKEALVRYLLCVEDAVLKNFKDAEQEFQAALELEQSSLYKRLFQNRLLSAANLLKVPDDVKTWLVEHQKMLG